MKIIVKHNQTEISIDEQSDDSTIRYNIDTIIQLIEKMSNEIQKIEDNYNKTYGE